MATAVSVPERPERASPLRRAEASAAAPDRVAPASARPADAPVGTQVEVHDQQQLEIRHDYAFGGDSVEERYTVDTFFFIPKNVGVSPANYPREQFYGDATALMRLDARKLPLAELADPACERSPLKAFTDALEAFRVSRRPPPARPVVVHVKLYAHLFARAVKSETKRLGAAVRRVKEGGERPISASEADLRAALPVMRRGLWAYRSVRSAFWPFENIADRSLAEAMRACDEYMSLVLEERLAELAMTISALSSREPEPAADEAAQVSEDAACATRMVAAIAALAQEEVKYRKRYGYLTMTDTSAEGEYFTYRSSILKKAVQKALYLEPLVQNQDTFLRNAVGAFGAMLAAIWALATQPTGAFSTSSGVARLLIFATAVGAYVLKDRIKTLTGELLMRRLRGFDRTMSLTGDSLSAMSLSSLRALIRERTKFVGEAEVPEEVRALRLAHRTVERTDTPNEWIIQHRKVVEIGCESGTGGLPDGYCVRDILRLNVRHFLARLDEAVDGVSYFDAARGTFQQAALPKVYHMNVVARIVHESGHERREDSLDHLRVILNKRGIVRVEVVGEDR